MRLEIHPRVFVAQQNLEQGLVRWGFIRNDPPEMAQGRQRRACARAAAAMEK